MVTAFTSTATEERCITSRWFRLATARRFSYWEGTGVAVDRVEAFKWLDLLRFYTQRSKDMQLKWRARGALDELQKGMSKAEIREGKQRAKQWDARQRSLSE